MRIGHFWFILITIQLVSHYFGYLIINSNSSMIAANYQASKSSSINDLVWKSEQLNWMAKQNDHIFRMNLLFENIPNWISTQKLGQMASLMHLYLLNGISIKILNIFIYVYKYTFRFYVVMTLIISVALLFGSTNRN